MKYKELIMTEQSTGKKTVLYENEEFKNFDYLSNLMMKYGYSENDYENLNDDIMSGIDHFDVNCLRIPSSSSAMIPFSVSAASTRSVCCALKNV